MGEHRDILSWQLCIWSYFHVFDLNFCSFLRFVYLPGQQTARSLWRVEPWYVVHMLAYALELNTTICRIAYSIWLGARRITKIGLKIMG